ncbi:hypothetical protein P280DRAFT_505498 [Massarina eburnea CBS 473.64]|uniref:Uncharacterized protein n=1 Tax=Massarina eburnea CBS 473.64 TaxID=1395130 RepID=A0A6A6SAB5_9PLEO|nr:hypothetical protein P280DRAFT_505498 [Massarina eburnea CBS 473.64]
MGSNPPACLIVYVRDTKSRWSVAPLWLIKSAKHQAGVPACYGENPILLVYVRRSRRMWLIAGLLPPLPSVDGVGICERRSSGSHPGSRRREDLAARQVSMGICLVSVTDRHVRMDVVLLSSGELRQGRPQEATLSDTLVLCWCGRGRHRGRRRRREGCLVEGNPTPTTLQQARRCQIADEEDTIPEVVPVTKLSCNSEGGQGRGRRHRRRPRAAEAVVVVELARGISGMAEEAATAPADDLKAQAAENIEKREAKMI